jgi:hypothetical protein
MSNVKVDCLEICLCDDKINNSNLKNMYAFAFYDSLLNRTVYVFQTHTIRVKSY